MTSVGPSIGGVFDNCSPASPVTPSFGTPGGQRSQKYGMRSISYGSGHYRQMIAGTLFPTETFLNSSQSSINTATTSLDTSSSNLDRDKSIDSGESLVKIGKKLSNKNDREDSEERCLADLKISNSSNQTAKRAPLTQEQEQLLLNNLPAILKEQYSKVVNVYQVKNADGDVLKRVFDQEIEVFDFFRIILLYFLKNISKRLFVKAVFMAESRKFL